MPIVSLPECGDAATLVAMKATVRMYVQLPKDIALNMSVNDVDALQQVAAKRVQDYLQGRIKELVISDHVSKREGTLPAGMQNPIDKTSIEIDIYDINFD